MTLIQQEKDRRRRVNEELQNLGVSMMYFKDLMPISTEIHDDHPKIPDFIEYKQELVLAAGVSISDEVIQNNNLYKLTIIFAICSQKDQFSRPAARDIILQRYKDYYSTGNNIDRWCINILLNKDNFASLKGLSKFILESIRFKITSEVSVYPKHILDTFDSIG